MVNGFPQNAALGAYGYGAATPQQFLHQAGGQHEYIIEEPSHMKPMHRQRMRMNIFAVFVSVFLPWLLFTLLFADVSFRLHYKMAPLCWAFVGLGALLVVYIGNLAVQNAMQMHQGNPGYKPTWFMFLFLTSLVAVVAGSA